MISAIEKLSAVDPWMIVLTLALVVTVIPLAVKTWRELLEALGLISKKEIEEQADEKRICDIEKRMKEVEDAFIKEKQEILDNQEKYHQQSIEIRNGLANKQDDILEMLTEMRREQTEIRKEQLDEKIQRMRWQILEVANYIRNKEEVNMEQLNNALDTYDDYEKVLEKNNLNNGQVDISIQLIREEKLKIMHG